MRSNVVRRYGMHGLFIMLHCMAMGARYGCTVWVHGMGAGHGMALWYGYPTKFDVTSWSITLSGQGAKLGNSKYDYRTSMYTRLDEDLNDTIRPNKTIRLDETK
ncbi:hypothetical protein IWZ00DRAFT_496777 [Phyllosticta capitalensis]